MPRYSQLYIERGPRIPDSARARRRLGSLVRAFPRGVSSTEMAEQLAINVGSRIRHEGRSWYDWDDTIQGCDVRDLLDMITEIYTFLRRTGNPTRAQTWLENVRLVLSEENLAYEVDGVGVVHPAIDAEFQRNRASALEALGGQRYANVRDAFERISPELLAQPPNFKEAWRAVFAAAEGLFRLMFPQAQRLTSGEIENRLRPIVQAQHAPDPTAQRAAAGLIEGFKKWVDASHNYRHEQGVQEPLQPPADIAILGISEGAAFIRWLADVDQAQLPGGP